MAFLFAQVPELFADAPLLPVPLLSPEHSASVVERVLDLADLWQQRADADFYTLGAASYLDGAWDGQPYSALAQRCNPILADRFADLYRLLAATLADLIGPVAFEPELALPGFHVFSPKPGLPLHAASKALAAAGGSVHFDLQHHAHTTFWSRYDAVDWKHPLSFTVALQLPAAGGGLQFWPGCVDALAPTSSSAQSVAYRVGEMVLFMLPLRHQIAPVQSLIPGDRRITLQGHGLRCDGVWRLYF
jgi:hypothetical protein